MHPIWTSLVIVALAGVAPAQTRETPADAPRLAQQSTPPDDGRDHLDDPNWLGPYVPTPTAVVDAALELAKVGEGDLVYDLGSGDGRIILAAAQRFQARAVGVEWNEKLCAKTSADVRRLGLEGRVKVIQGDIFEQDVSSASVVTAYLLPKSWERLAPILERQLSKGVRVVAVNDPVPGWPVVEKRHIEGESAIKSWDLYLYRMR
ncbi:MAG: class I SAM-dependent methyltransferase [Acidobacteria bacterium]|nr:class I SAM-dependent methyltransferase [Acidobacteriota bacterium]